MGMSSKVEKLFPFYCLNINEFSIECPKINRSCLNFNEQNILIISAGNINLLLKSLIYHRNRCLSEEETNT